MDEDANARFQAFLQPIRDLASNWDVEIADSLDNYLQELEEHQWNIIQKDLRDKGECDEFEGNELKGLNFAEAALLIQGSTNIYSKKVEYLHQLVLKTLETVSNRKGNRSNDDNNISGNEKNKGNNGVSLSAMDDDRLLFGTDPSYLLLDDVVEEGHNIDINEASSLQKGNRRSSGRHSMSGDFSRASMVLMHSMMNEDHGGNTLKMVYKYYIIYYCYYYLINYLFIIF
jgi:condensin-2 complex subunit H2